VVADEVRKLAEKTQKATSEVEVNINVLKQNSANISDDGNKLQESIQESISQLSEFKERFSNIIEKSDQLKIENNNIVDKIFLNLAKLNHINFKAKAYNGIIKHQIPEQMPDHIHCKFGKWLNSKGKAIYGNTQAFRELLKYHEGVHKNILQALHYIESNSVVQNSDRVAKLFEEAEKDAIKVFELSDEMVEEKRNS